MAGWYDQMKIALQLWQSHLGGCSQFWGGGERGGSPLLGWLMPEWEESCVFDEESTVDCRRMLCSDLI